MIDFAFETREAYAFLAGKAQNIINEVEPVHGEWGRSRVKSLESFVGKLLSVGTSDLTHVQDTAGMMVFCDTVDDCYISLHTLMSKGFLPYYKFWDTLQKQDGYRSLDVNLRKDHLSFELQIRTHVLQEAYESSHESYKESQLSSRQQVLLTKVTKQLHRIMPMATASMEHVNALSLHELLIDITYHPVEYWQWKDIVTTPISRALCEQHDVGLPPDRLDPRRKR